MIKIKFINSFIVNLKAILHGYGFYLCILFTLFLCSCTGIYFDTVTNNEYSVIRVLVSFDKQFMIKNTDFCSINIVLKGAGSWLSMFIPIISAFAFIPFICDESESKFKRNVIVRSSKINYCTSKFFSSCFSGGFAIMFGYILFILFAFMLFPNITEYSSDIKDIYIDELTGYYPKFDEYGTVYVLAIKSVEMFIYGFLSAIPAMLLTCITKNKYIILCIPFFLKYATDQSYLKISSEYYNCYNQIGEKIIKVINIIDSDSILSIFESSDYKWIVIYNVFIIFVAFSLYLTIQYRRFDCSE